MPQRSGAPSLLPLLRSKTQAVLLERLFLRPDATWTVAALARDLDVTDMSVRRELQRMLDAGIVERETIGRQGVYRPDAASPLYEPLRQLIERSVGLEALLRTVVEDLDGVEAAAIFGSWARGQVDAYSDVDVLVIGDVDYGQLVGELSALRSRTGREINPVWMTRTEFRERRDSGFVREILSSPMLVLVGTIDD